MFPSPVEAALDLSLKFEEPDEAERKAILAGLLKHIALESASHDRSQNTGVYKGGFKTITGKSGIPVTLTVSGDASGMTIRMQVSSHEQDIPKFAELMEKITQALGGKLEKPPAKTHASERG